MCTYISFIMPPGIKEPAIQEAFRSLGIRAGLQENPHLRQQLKKGEQAFVRVDDCNCGTLVGQETFPKSGLNSDPSVRADRLREKGWSEAKVQRALDDSQRTSVEHRKRRQQAEEASWEKFFACCLTELRLPYVGLIWHEYNGALTEENFKLASRHKVHPGTNLSADLQMIPENTPYIFHL